ncbi:MAG: 50S ribosomal protein L24 [Candidatus Gastranaerophilaceae bacterium]
MTNKDKKDLHVKTGDRVVVIAGKDKGKIGNVKKVDRTTGRVVVEGANMITKAQKPQPAAGIQGGLIKMEAPIDSSNVMIVCPACEKASRPATKVIDGKKVRVCKKCGEQLDA